MTAGRKERKGGREGRERKGEKGKERKERKERIVDRFQLALFPRPRFESRLATVLLPRGQSAGKAQSTAFARTLGPAGRLEARAVECFGSIRNWLAGIIDMYIYIYGSGSFLGAFSF